MPSAAFDEDNPQLYAQPFLPQCTVETPTLIADVGGCLTFDRNINFAAGFDSAASLNSEITAKLGATAIQDVSSNRFAARVQLSLPPSEWVYAGNGMSYWTQPALSVSEAYVAAGSDRAFLLVGKTTKTIVNTSDDKPLNFLGLFGTDSADAIPSDDMQDDGVIWPQYINMYSTSPLPPVISVAGPSVQGIWKPSNEVAVALAVEALDKNGTLAGVLSYDDGATTAHLSLLQTGSLSGNTRSAFHAGATTTMPLGRVRVAIAGDDSGAIHAMTSGEIVLSGVTLSASVDAANRQKFGQEWLGVGISASSEFGDGIVGDIGFSWAGLDRAWVQQVWLLGARITFPLANDFSLRTSIYQYEMSGGFQNATTALSSEMQWTPSQDFEARLKGEFNNLGAYKVVLRAKRSFGVQLN